MHKIALRNDNFERRLNLMRHLHPHKRVYAEVGELAVVFNLI